MKKSKWQRFGSDVISYAIIIIMVIFIKKYIVSPIKVNGDSMNQTLLDKDIMILNEITYRFNNINRTDIVVVSERGELLIKRVIGLPGEKIKCVNGIVYVNDVALSESYASSPTEDFAEIKIQDNEYFVMGDNRSVSLDSRVYGTYSKSEIRGKATLTIYPFDRFGFK